LIEDKLREGGWSDHEAGGDTMFVAASAWALGLSAKVLQPGETPEGVIGSMVKRMGMPTVRVATKQAMRFLGGHFVLGETIEAALKRGRENAALGYRHSFDMLGEGARTWADAKRYYDSYAQAIHAIGKAARGMALPKADGISVKLSALHPKYDARNRDAVLAQLVPDVLALAQLAKGYNLNFTVDAEEADRLALSLDVIDAVFADESLAGWGGFGLAIQAYQKRAAAVIEHIDALCRRHGRTMMVRLVKGAYWDTEIKRAQERGLDGFPVFTRKPATDVNYLACAAQMLAKRERLFCQFATHNALTVAAIVEMAGDDLSGFEFQRLHGMGEALYRQVSEAGPNNKKAIGHPVPCRIYAPVGGYRDLLAYLVRRLLENGANSSFVAQAGDPNVPVEEMLTTARDLLGENFVHPHINRPEDLFGARRNSKGVEFGDPDALAALTDAMAQYAGETLSAGDALRGDQRSIANPADSGDIVGTVRHASTQDVSDAVKRAKEAFGPWSATKADGRAQCLERMADLLEENRARIMALLTREAGKTHDDGIAELREAVDFCRYYGAQARHHFSAPIDLPGPAGEANRLSYTGRGVFVCISPWNFPLAIFLGQITAALAAGNCVVAKPAEQTPLIADMAIRLLHQAGVPKDAVCLLPGDGSVGAALVDHPAIAGVAFTGSTKTAQAINRALAAKDGPIVPLIAETGGLNAMIVDATALPEQVADDVVMSAFRSAGQRCSALRLLYVQDSVADRMLEMIAGAADVLSLGDPVRTNTDIGPIIDANQKAMLQQHVDAMGREAKIVYAGQAPTKGHFFAPHIIELKRPEQLTHEVFGPILHVVRFKAAELDGVIDAVNATGYGLTFGVHSRIQARIDDIQRRVHAGNVYVNRNIIGAIVGSQPFGGNGLSGTGPKAGGPNYVLRFAHEKVVSDNTAAAGGNASLIALGDIA
ncbi:MAG: bifunctional proline dehydrogenase/L-glutamate gamma-semialdehyde dehydrogenase PutA, partial [Ahrensia sp.]